VRKNTADVQLAPRLLRYHQRMRKFTRSAAGTVLLAAGLGLAGLGGATSAQAGSLPDFFHACPGHPNWTFAHCVRARR
jgi:hypothetical protein